MSTSILNDVKTTLGISLSEYAFDADIVMHINATLAILNQLGVGPTNGLIITDYTTSWSAFLSDSPNLSLVRSYVYLRVRTLFDPPTTSYLIEAMNKQIIELEHRISINRELVSWTAPVVVRT